MKAEAHASVGRPREFDVEEALSAALKVFWRKGYEGASLTDLTEAMGVTRPSLYCAFGNKESLFKKALDLYEREKLSFIDCSLTAPTGREAIERFLYNACDAYAADPETPGCMGINSILSCQGIASEAVRQELIDRKIDVESRLRARLERAKADGDFGPDVDPAALATYVVTVGQGIALQAGTGATNATMKKVVATALQACPCVRQTAAA
jgi:AcrR family transcriptional regulator